jgi:hypothetical protein
MGLKMKITAMDTLLSRNLPMITNRLEFFRQNIGPSPTITPRIDFDGQLSLTELTEDSISTDDYHDGGAMDTPPADTPPSDVSSDSGDEETADILYDKKIPKPKGQVGHPGSGGYSLDFVLRRWGSPLITGVNISAYSLMIKINVHSIMITATSETKSRRISGHLQFL